MKLFTSIPNICNILIFLITILLPMTHLSEKLKVKKTAVQLKIHHELNRDDLVDYTSYTIEKNSDKSIKS